MVPSALPGQKENLRIVSNVSGFNSKLTFSKGDNKCVDKHVEVKRYGNQKVFVLFDEVFCCFLLKAYFFKRARVQIYVFLKESE